MLRSVSTGVCFTGVLTAASLTLAAKPAATRRAWLAWASTNLANLHGHPLGALVASAFLTDGYVWAWVTTAFVGLVSTGRMFGNVRTVLLVATAHVVSTLVSEGILAYQIASGTVASDARYLTDVGPSYIVVCALVAAIGYGRRPGQLVNAIAFLLIAPYLFEGLFDLEVSAVGHLCSAIIGLVLGYALYPYSPNRTSPPRWFGDARGP